MSAAAPRPRRWRRRLGLGTLLLLCAAALWLAWLVATDGGRDTLLGRVLGLLPPGSLQWERAEGTVRGPLVLHGLRYSHDGVEFTATRVMLDPDLLPVLGRRLQLDRLEVEGAVLVLPPAADEPFAFPTWPEVLPRLPMPLRIGAETVVVDGLQVRRDGEELVTLHRIDARALRLESEGFAAGAMTVDSNRGRLTLKGEYLPTRNFRTDLTGTLRREASEATPALDLQFAAKGDLDALRVEASGEAPGRLSLEAELRAAGAGTDWTVAAVSEGLDPALFGAAPGPAWRGRLDARGTDGAARLSGELAQGERVIRIEPSQLVLVGQGLRAEPLELTLAEGPLRITGELRLGDDAPSVDAVLASPGLRFEPTAGETGAQAVTAAGELHAVGALDAWRLEGEATLTRGADRARLVLAGTGDREQLQLDALEMASASGSLKGRGGLRWSPALGFGIDAAMAGFDPGYFLPDYPGALSGDVLADGEQSADGRWTGRLQVESLRGTLRERPVSGRFALDWRGDRGEGDASLRLGDSVLEARGGFGARYDLALRAAPLQLADLLAGAQGRLEGTLSLRGPAAAPDFAGDLRGKDLAWDGDRIASLQLGGSLPARGDGGDARLSATGLDVSGVAFDELSLHARGSLAAMRLEGRARGGHGELALTAQLGREGADWRGRLEALRLAADEAPVLSLQSPAAFRLGPDRRSLERACLVAEAMDGRLCLAATGDTVDFTGENLPLALAQPWLQPDDALALEARGQVDARATLRRGRDGRWRGEGELTSATGGLHLEDEGERELFGYRDLRLDVRLDGERIDAELAAALAADGRISARLRTGLADGAALDGELQLDVRDLTWLELFSEDLAAPTGRLQGRLALAGTRAAPALSGQARLIGFAGELPALGLKLREGEFTLVGEAGGSARVDGSLRSGEGLLRVDGSLDLRDPDSPLQLVLRGERVTLASTAELYLVGSPDFELRHRRGELQVRGELVVPEARVDLEALDSEVAVSPDVVVLDPLDGPGAGRALPLDLDFRVRLGEDVRLKGFGLDGRLGGQLRLRESPGRRATATGTLEASGKYRAYGQALDITRARLAYANSPYDDPVLDIRAERDFDEVTVGVQVRGSARRPETTLVSTPSMETSEALAWLVFGRPLSSASEREGEQLGAAAQALGAGGNLVAMQLGAKLGLDQAGVTDSRNLGGATFTVGKYVSPRLFLSYGVSLVGSGQVVTLKYLLRRGFDISLESGNESAASLNWRTER